EYRRFRQGYLTLWRKYFDPIGMRFSLGEKQMRVETYILPLLQNSQYNFLREMAGGSTTSLNLALFSARTLLQFQVHLSPQSRGWVQNGLGEWGFFRFDDALIYSKLVELWIRQDVDPDARATYWGDSGQLIQQLPLTAGVQIGERKAFATTMNNLRNFADSMGPRTVEKVTYKNVPITRVRFAE